MQEKSKREDTGAVVASASSERTGSSRLPRLTLRRIAVLAGLALLTGVLLLSLGGGRVAIDALLAVDVRFLLLAVLVHYSGFAVRGHRWQRLLGVMGHRLSFLFVTGLLLAGWFVSALLPARAGDLLRVAVLRLPGAQRTPVPVANSLGSIVLERALDILAILILGAGFSLWIAQGRLPSWVTAFYVAAVVLLALLGIVMLLLPPLMGWLARLSDNGWWTALIDFLAQFMTSLRLLFRDPASAMLVTVESLYIWLCDVALLYLAIRSLGQTVSVGEAGFVALTVDIIAAVPITPGGIGQIEAAYAALLSLAATSITNVAVVVLVTRLVSYWSFLLFSGVVTFAAGFGALLTHNIDDNTLT